MRLRTVVLLVALALVIGVGVAFWRGSGPLPDPEGCLASDGGHTVALDPEQGQNATLIAAIGVRRGLPARAVSIALATAYQESKIRNLPSGDRDSLGLFQQRPSQGWGTRQQISNPYYSINAFYDVLAKIKNYQSMRITDAAQKVQRSGFPEAYQDHAARRAHAGLGAHRLQPGRQVHLRGAPAQRQGLRRQRGPAGPSGLTAPSTSPARAPARTSPSRSAAQPAGAWAGRSRSSWSPTAATLRQDLVAYDGKRWRTGRDSEDGWTKGSEGSATRLVVEMG